MTENAAKRLLHDAVENAAEGISQAEDAVRSGQFEEAAQLFDGAATIMRKSLQISSTSSINGSSFNTNRISVDADIFESHAWYNRSLTFDASSSEGIDHSIAALERCHLLRNAALATAQRSGIMTAEEVRLLEGNLRHTEGDRFVQCCNRELLCADDITLSPADTFSNSDREHPESKSTRAIHFQRAAAFLRAAAFVKDEAASCSESAAQRMNREAGALLDRGSRASILADLAEENVDLEQEIALLIDALDHIRKATELLNEAQRTDESVVKQQNQDSVLQARGEIEQRLEEANRRNVGEQRNATKPSADTNLSSNADQDAFQVSVEYPGTPVENLTGILLCTLRNDSSVELKNVRINAAGAFSGDLRDRVERIDPFSRGMASIALRPEQTGYQKLWVEVHFDVIENGAVIPQTLANETTVLVLSATVAPPRSDDGRPPELHVHGDYIEGSVITDSIVYRSNIGKGTESQ